METGTVASGRLIGCVLLPHLAARLHCVDHGEPAGPLILTTSASSGRVVADALRVSPLVRTGMPLVDALALEPAASVEPLDQRRVSGLLNGLADDLHALWGIVEVDGDDMGVVYFDAGPGAATAAPGLLRELIEPVMALAPPGVVFRLGLGLGAFLARCAAHCAADGSGFAAPVDVAAWLAGWPVSALPLPPADAGRLKDRGVHTLGDLAALSVEQASMLLGSRGERMRRLAGGKDDRVLIGRQTPRRISETLTFPYPVDTRDGIAAGVEALCARIWRRYPAGGLSVGRATLSGSLEWGGSWTHDRALRRRPERAEDLRRMILAGLSATTVNGDARWPDGALVDLTIALDDLGDGAVSQPDLWGEKVSRLDAGSAAMTVDGVDRLVAFEPGALLPERRWALDGDLALLNRPRPCRVRCRSGIPAAVERRGSWRAVDAVLDLWEVETDWWAARPVHRRYWRLLSDEAGVLTVFRDLLAGDWYLQSG